MTTRRLVAVAAVAALFVPASAPATPTTPAPSAPTAAWTGVSEVVVVDVAASGVVSGSPSQATVVTAVGSSTVPVGVPMSSAGLRRIGPGSPPPVIDDVAQFSFDGSGTQTQTVSSTFAQPLPVTITPTYELDGESTTPDELRVDPVRPGATERHVDGHVRDRQRDEPDHDRVLRGPRRCTPHRGRHAGSPDRRGAVAHVPEEHLGHRRARRVAHARRVGCRSQLARPARATTRSHAAVDLLLGEPDERAGPARARLSLGVVVPAKPPSGEAPAAVGAAAATAQSAAQVRVAQAQAEAQASLEQRASVAGGARAGAARRAGAGEPRAPTDARTTSRSCPTTSSRTSRRRSRRPRQVRAASLETAVTQIRDALDGLGAEVADHSDRLAAHSGLLDLLEAATEALSANAGGLAAQASEHVTAAA